MSVLRMKQQLGLDPPAELGLAAGKVMMHLGTARPAPRAHHLQSIVSRRQPARAVRAPSGDGGVSDIVMYQVGLLRTMVRQKYQLLLLRLRYLNRCARTERPHTHFVARRRHCKSY